MKKREILERIAGGLIVSCQALPQEPLHSSFIMGRMAVAAKEGGASGIRANGVEDIETIRREVDLPVIGIIKAEVLLSLGVEILALDATCRPRPGGISLEEFFLPLRQRYPEQVFMADCATFEECVRAQELGFDLVGTTLRSYTPETKGVEIPDYRLLKQLTRELSTPVIAEGGIWERDQLGKVFACRVHAAVVGTAITRPREITRRFVEAIGSHQLERERRNLGGRE